ncbi:ABC transporter substrate-binding protein [Brevibacterium sp. 50QC2O2]|uniref:ABC transporter substrate-binding protein n=1 Tax=Brevibacterium sp. 50QC2O2 TaxID=2968459 RepID=UPI00211C7A33|nr:ABC transporter substrate-binding protein [Brevibacterium sp. 50QC2O2]MCQ9388180.1 ABC transporter substrate-binding protein [Brevibacterium sp. 50QC2O2]
MKKNRIWSLAAGIAAASLLLTACGSGGSSDGGTGGDDAKGKTVAIVSKGYQHQFWQAVKKGAEDKGKELGVNVTFEGPDKETNVDQQVTQLQGALDKQPAALGIAALDSKAVIPLLDQAKSSNIPVIAFDSGVDSDIPVTTVATDNKAAAAEVAKHLAEAIDHKGKIAVVTHSETAVTGIDRRDGFVEYMKENEPNIEIVAQQNADGDQAKSADTTKAIIQSNPDLVGIYGTNEGAAVGVLQGVKELGDKKVKVVGFDSTKTQMDAIRGGTELGAVTQDPISIGAQTVQAAVDAIEGKDLKKTTPTGYYWYDKSNIDDEKIKPLLYE